MGRVKSNSADALRHGDPEPVEFGLGALTLLVGLWLAIPFNTYASGPIYQKVPLPEPIVAILMAVVGAMVFVVHAAGMRRFWWPRRVVAAVMVGLWAGWAVCFFRESAPSIAVPLTLGPMAGSLWYAVRI